MQDLWDNTKRTNLQSMGIEGEGVQAKGVESIFNTVIAEYYPNLEN
jgi:hypothetical protein